jgi:hypothetical protein
MLRPVSSPNCRNTTRHQSRRFARLLQGFNETRKREQAATALKSYNTAAEAYRLRLSHEPFRRGQSIGADMAIMLQH